MDDTKYLLNYLLIIIVILIIINIYNYFNCKYISYK